MTRTKPKRRVKAADPDAVHCDTCRRKIPKREIRPGPVVCARCRRDDWPGVRIDRGTAAITTPEERRQIQAASDAARVRALSPSPERELTREHLVKNAQKNGALKILAQRLQWDAEREQRPVPDDDTALEQAKDVVSAFGRTSPRNMPRVIIEPTAAGRHERLFLGTYPRGRRVKTGGKVPHLPSPPSKRRTAEDAKIAKDAAERVEKLRATRAARQALKELRADEVGNSDRQREAWTLVYVALGGKRGAKAEAARRMGIERQTLADLLAKFDRAKKRAESGASGGTDNGAGFGC